MQYVQITFEIADNEQRQLLIATLTDDIEGFEEREYQLIAYLLERDFNEAAINTIATQYNVAYTIEYIPQQNWNQQWEENFDPVIVDDFCTIRADFHSIPINTTHEIVITPKMSFGTGHHATTQLVIKQMRHLSFANKQVLDFGTGTGILAILAEMLGAAEVLAIDNDEWSYENARENAARNHSQRVEVQLNTLDHISTSFDVILANINRHILLQYMEQLSNRLHPSGHIIMSGLLLEDKEMIVTSAAENGLQLKAYGSLNNWIVLLFENQPAL